MLYGVYEENSKQLMLKENIQVLFRGMCCIYVIGLNRRGQVSTKANEKLL